MHPRSGRRRRAVLDSYGFRVLQRPHRAVKLVQLRVTTPAEPCGELSDEV